MEQGLRKLFSIVLVFLIFISSAIADEIPVTGTDTPSKFDVRFTKLLRHWHVPGATVAIVKNGKIIATRGYGWSSLNPKVKMQPDTTFRIASVSKTITTVAVLKLVQEKRLQLNDRVFDILDDLTPLHGRTNSHLDQITVRDLLNMSSGWYTSNGHLDPMFGPWPQHAITELNGNTPPTCIDATRLMMGHRFGFKPGTQFSYSNLNYCMLGLIVSKVTQNNYSPSSYISFVQNKILQPSGMNNTRIGSTSYFNRNFMETHYFNSMPGKTNVDGLPYSNSAIIEKNYADGGWTSSALDLARFLQSLSDYKILSQPTLRTMLSRPTFMTKPYHYFSMGWTVKKINGHWYWSKHGSFTGTTAQIIQKDDGTSYVALFNTEPPSKVMFFRQVQKVLISG